MLLTLALGTNLGDRPARLAAARRLITERINPLVAASNVLETAAWGVTNQPDFLNQVVVAEYSLHPPPLRPQLHALLDLTQGIEAELGRQRRQHWGPRTCDIDLIFWGDLHYEDERLSLPHPWWKVREFVAPLVREVRGREGESGGESGGGGVLYRLSRFSPLPPTGSPPGGSEARGSRQSKVETEDE